MTINDYNVIWDTPSQNAAGSMPIGNGEVGLNVWLEPSGDLLFYIARTDAWSECNRLLKLGRIRVRITPMILQPFRQELKLRDGQIVITAGDLTLRIFVDADAPVIYVTGTGRIPRTVSAKLECWRNAPRRLAGKELDSCWSMRTAPDHIEVWESADVVEGATWYHRNETSIVPFTLRHQGLKAKIDDPLLHRTFGGQIAGNSETPVRNFTVTIATHSAPTKSVADWKRQLPKPVPAATAAKRTAAWWRKFWERSWIFVSDKAVTQAYVLQRWVAACGGRGNYPIKFNGSLFTVEPNLLKEELALNPDWRRWGDCYWFQNTRLPYFPMIASGDFDLARRLFWFYRDMLPLCEQRAKQYHGVAGAYFPETATIYGTYSNNDYGWDRTGHKTNEVLCPWWQYAWQQGLELVALMLDYYEHTLDKKFLTTELIPMADSVLQYYDTRFKRKAGKLVISPTQSAETYWFDVVNDTPSIAGLMDVLPRLLKLPTGDKKLYQRLLDATPALPVKNGRIIPAEKYKDERRNVENPELYAIWPFPVAGALAAPTFQARIERASFGWQYDGQCAAIAGLTDEAKQLLLGKITNSHSAFRFPAMWGPNYDWLPDQDHGSNILLTLQHMVLQCRGEKIHVLPAWPKDWDVSFKLHAPGQTVVECVYQAGKIRKLKVTPAARRRDVH